MLYRLYVDEVGTDDLAHVTDDQNRYLSLSGVAMDQDYARDHASPAMNALKAEIFHHDPDQPVIFHRKHIMNKRGAFHRLIDHDVRSRFDAGLVDYLTHTKFVVITVLIDKLGMLNQRHWQEKHPYHYLMRILVEKYVQWLERMGGTGDIMPEMRKGAKDQALQRAYETVRRFGSDYVDAARIKASIPSSKLKFRDKAANVTGLQISDLIAHPSHTHVRCLQRHQVVPGPFAELIIPILLATKYDRSPWNSRIVGYGIKYLP